MTAVLDTQFPAPAGVRAGAFGNATHLVCRACGEQSPLGPFYACMECFGPLEVGYEFPTDHPRSRSRPARRASGATRRCCRCPPTSRPSAPPTPASPGWSTPATSPPTWACGSCG